jgi:chromosome segregation ATPase
MSESKTAPKRTRTSAASVANAEPKNDRLALASAISQIVNKGDAWVRAIDDFKELRQNLDQSLETDMQTKKRQREELDVEYEQCKRAKKIHMEQELSEFGYAAALKLLSERKEVAINEHELQQLRQRLSDLEKRGDTEVKKAVEEEKDRAKKTLAIETKTLQLQHDKEMAQLTSGQESLKQQLQSAKEEIQKAEERLNAQRDLCQKIAEASAKAQIVQHLGGK